MEEVQVITPRDVDMTATRIDEDELEPESEGEALWDKLQRANAAESEDGTGGMTLLPAPIEVPAEPESEPYSALFAELLNDTDTGVKPNFGDDAMDWVGLPDAEVARIERVTGKRNPFGPQNDVVPQRLHGRDESKPEPEVEEEEAPRMQTVPLPPPEQHRDARQPLVPSHTQTGLSGVQAYPVHHVPTPAHFQTVTVKSSGDRLLDEEEEEEMMMMDESAFEEELEEEVWDDVQEESDSENVANYAEEQHARELALGEWARQRILDGVWTAPYDDERLIQSAAASSLSILSRQQASAINPSPSATSAPRPNTVHAHDRIPTVTLAHALNRAHATSLRGVVLPALQNLVRRLVWLSCGGNLERAQARVRAMVREEPSALDGERGLAEWVLARLGEQRSWRAVVKPKPHHHHHHHHHECHERHDHQHAHAHKHTRTPSNTMSAGSHSTASSGSSGNGARARRARVRRRVSSRRRRHRRRARSRLAHL
ncbi:hypothetical protein BKA62DRAFT_51308 [Auriculariales sp. MPI-PUGE-AT-0066]|nr:hypothetical protein BKA62DRAFT_51308 [Auriculariales sp. MPI-PUGE-AT-0066]